jgi:hypothetical protein
LAWSLDSDTNEQRLASTAVLITDCCPAAADTFWRGMLAAFSSTRRIVFKKETIAAGRRDKVRSHNDRPSGVGRLRQSDSDAGNERSQQ